MKKLKKELWKLIGRYGEAMGEAGYQSHNDLDYFLEWADKIDDAEIKLKAFIEGLEIRER